MLINLSPPLSLRSPWPGRLGSLSWVAKALSLRAININKLHGFGLNYLPLIVAQLKIQPPATQASLNRDYLVSVSGGPFSSKSFVLCRQTWKPHAAPLRGLKSSLEQRRLSLHWTAYIRGSLPLPFPDPGSLLPKDSASISFLNPQDSAYGLCQIRVALVGHGIRPTNDSTTPDSREGILHLCTGKAALAAAPLHCGREAPLGSLDPAALGHHLRVATCAVPPCRGPFLELPEFSVT